LRDGWIESALSRFSVVLRILPYPDILTGMYQTCNVQNVWLVVKTKVKENAKGRAEAEKQ
jgi:hypothetical protein